MGGEWHILPFSDQLFLILFLVTFSMELMGRSSKHFKMVANRPCIIVHLIGPVSLFI